MAGMIAVAKEAGVEIVTPIAAGAPPSGRVSDTAYQYITDCIVEAAEGCDGLLLDLHGAMVTEDFEDGEGELLRRVRAVVGPNIPVVISLDYHVNLTQAMVQHCDGMAVYLTYPHIDRAETGQRAARILSTVLERGQPPFRKFIKLPFLIPLNFQCTMVPPSADIVAASVAGEVGDVAAGLMPVGA